MNSAELEIKKSRFLSFLFNISNEKQAMDTIENLKKEHKKATHVCFAFKIVNGCEIVKFSDDNEPSGSAGKPILTVIEKSGLKNVLVVVIRYFGGIKLGVGGLFRAYTKSAALVCEMEKK